MILLGGTVNVFLGIRSYGEKLEEQETSFNAMPLFYGLCIGIVAVYALFLVLGECVMGQQHEYLMIAESSHGDLGEESSLMGGDKPSTSLEWRRRLREGSISVFGWRCRIGNLVGALFWFAGIGLTAGLILALCFAP